jgi:hypothetical protein
MLRQASVMPSSLRMLCFALGCACLLMPGESTLAQEKQERQVEGLDLNGEALAKFTGSAWSLVYPDRDYQGGCVIGFLAFRFSPTGYFIYNNRIRGSWRVDELGNLVLRTKDGVKFTLIVEGNTLHPTENLPFARRFYQFQKCQA